MKIRVCHNGDDVFVAWKPKGFIADCRGFALLRRRNGVEEAVSTWVGFENDDYTEGERRASTNWPIQKYQWTDYMANPGDTLQYRVVPMVGRDSKNLRADAANASAWSGKVVLAQQAAPKIEAHFNRGIVAAQWVSRRLDVTDTDLGTGKLRKAITTPGDPLRGYLSGPLGARLFEILAAAAKDKRDVYAALYELHDHQLEDALLALGKRAHVVLANGSVKKSGQDQNAEAREKLAGTIDLYDRMISPRALGHNKFLVICDKQKKPRWVWTGSQNWTSTGLCTQANNSLLIDDAAIAREFRSQWERLRDAGNETPDALEQSNSKPRDRDIGKVAMRVWFTPTVGQVDLKEASKIIAGAKQSILFLMFNPGPADTLLNRIIDAARTKAKKRLYIKGAINQDPSTKKTAVQLFDHENTDNADYDVVLPAAIDEATKFFRREMKKLPQTFAMVHSKVVVVDAFGERPVVLTGSHNLGPKASSVNDENLLIVRDSGVAAAYATNIMAIYNQYRWRFRRQAQPASRRWKGLQDSDTWQKGYLKPGSAALREIDFWVGG